MKPMQTVYTHVKNYINLKRKNPDCSFDVRTSFLGDVVCEGHNGIEKNCIIDSVTMGYGSYIGYGGCIYNTSIGRFCSIGRNLKIIRGQHPTEKFVSTYPAFYRKEGSMGLYYTVKQLFNENRYADEDKSLAVLIGNDVWIADNVSIMEGITIGDGAVIAAGATVVKNVPPYSIVGGVPAKIIRYRFDQKDINFLLKTKWWMKDYKWIEKNAQAFSDINQFRLIFMEE